MAFAFFRRRQKMVIIIMAVLMVAFLVGFQGFSTLLAPSAGKTTIGTMYGGKEKITQNAMVQAANELKVLQDGVLVRSTPDGRMAVVDPLFGPLASQSLDEHEMDRVYAVLIAEARHMGVQVTPDEVSSFLTALGLAPDSENYKAMLRRLGYSFSAAGDMLNASIADWLLVRKAAIAGSPQTVPSLPAVEHLFAAVMEKIDLRMAEIPASKFESSMKDPTEAQVQEFFQKYRSTAPGRFASCDSMGFGYSQPNRLEMDYLLVSKDAIEKTVQVDEAEARAYYRRNAEQFTKLVPVQTPATASTKPASTSVATTSAATASAPQSQAVQMTLIEALPEIHKRLADLEADRQMSKVVLEIQNLLSKSTAKGGAAYAQVRADMVLDGPARDVLKAKLASVDIADRPLADALGELARSAGISAISYPLGLKTTDDKVLRGQTPVTVKGKDITLGEALDQIQTQLKAPKIEWTMCRGLGAVLWAKGPAAADTFPVKAYQSGLIDLMALATDPVLGSATTGIGEGGTPLVQVAFTAKEFKHEGKNVPLVDVGRAGPEMYLHTSDGAVSGRLLWTLARVEPAHEPDKISPEIRSQIVHDWKIQQAYAVALERGRALTSEAKREGLEKAAAGMKITTTTTPQPISRLSPMYNGRTFVFVPAPVPGMDLPSMPAQTKRECLAKIHQQIFALAPKNVELPNAQTPEATTLLEMPLRQSVYVIQRVGYTPAQRSQFEAFSGELQRNLAMEQASLALRDWFAYNNLVKRTDFKDQEGRLPVDNSSPLDTVED
ncbi:MAG: hypothetical protein LLG01_14680 [Planctomycetaceae bacterium]|nr:hypothetical protein [Planctomycetaceae bacterium]